MKPETLTKEHAAQVAEICRRHHVRRLTLFGSAATGAFKPGTSDVDLLVDFQVLAPSEYATHYFGLQEDLEALLGVPVDLVEPKAIRNPFFTQAIAHAQVVLYEAA